MKVYCDTNIFVDYFQERSDGIRPLKEFAFLFFSKGWNCAFELIISDWLETELRRHLSDKQVNEIFNHYDALHKLIRVKEEQGDRETARKISVHWDDALHAVLAKKAGADYLATRNVGHFEGCEELVRVVFPEFI